MLAVRDNVLLSCEWFSKHGQVQENCSLQFANELENCRARPSVECINHLCKFASAVSFVHYASFGQVERPKIVR